MATRIPSAVGEGAGRAAETLLGSFIEGKRHGLLSREVATRERGQALSELINGMGLVQPGQTLSEARWLHRPFRELYPDLDPEDPESIGGMVFNPETLQTVIGEELLARYEALPEEEKEKYFSEGLPRAAINIMTGRSDSPEELALVRDTAGIMGDLVQRFEPTERDSTNIARRLFGLDMLVDVVDPRTGEVATFDGELPARLSVDLLKHFTLLDLYNRQLMASIDKDHDHVGEFMRQLETTGIVISRQVAHRIISTVHGASEEEFNAFVERARQDPSIFKALQIYIHGARIADEHASEFFGAFPGGDQFANTLRILSEVSGSLGQTETASIYRQMLQEFIAGGWPVASPRRGLWEGILPPTRSRGFELPQSPEGTPGAEIEDPSALLESLGIDPTAVVRGGEGPSPMNVPGESPSAQHLQRVHTALGRLISGDITLGQLRREGFSSADIAILREAMQVAEREGLTSGQP